MAGVYGEFIGFFPELFEEFEVYKYETDVASGYKLTFSRKVVGVRQTDNTEVHTDRYRRLPVLDFFKGWYLWTYEDIKLSSEFVKIDGQMYRPMQDSEFNREGGFWETKLERIVGNDGTKNFTPQIAQGEFS